uniref:DUF397 domain-containing protein n=1 Tax=Pseudonocardia sp. CA-138482 TaxID=3240023 RepID=UPI003F4914C0
MTKPPATGWRKSSYSSDQGNTKCVEIANGDDGGRWVRDSKNPAQAPHYFTADEWRAFILGVKDGEFD